MTAHERKDFYVDLAEEILASPKYSSFGIPIETLLSLFFEEGEKHRHQKSLVKAVRQKLHNIMAPYLGDLDYDVAVQWLDDIEPGNTENTIDACKQIMNAHASTRERIPILHEFYEAIFNKLGKPVSIIDLACGLNPFSIPWMGLPNQVQYYAYDIHKPRIALINRFLKRLGMQPLAEVRDVIVDPPRQAVDVAFLFKEAHRMEQRKKGCSRVLWQQLNVRCLVVSLPSTSLSGQHDLSERHRHMVQKIIAGLPWDLSEIALPGELIFVIEKKYGQK